VKKAEEAQRKAKEAAAAAEKEKQVRAAKAMPVLKVCQRASEMQALLTMPQRRAQEVTEDSEDAPEVPPAKVSQIGGALCVHCLCRKRNWLWQRCRNHLFSSRGPVSAASSVEWPATRKRTAA
jgi:hypothetical protein